VERLWSVGPFADSPDASTPHPPERQAIDLAAEYNSAGQSLAWQDVQADDTKFTWPVPRGAHSSTYAHFRLQSSARQPAMIKFATEGSQLRVWHNGVLVHEGALQPEPTNLTLDVQPGSNDLLVRLIADGAEGSTSLAATVQARAEITVTQPDRLDASLLAERLRGAGSTGETVSAEFASLDWSAEAARGDNSRGRALFGSLGCMKCHSITHDQAGGGGPSLAEARRRFTVPHLVESVLLPSRQIAAPFRATTIATSGGELLTGLVVSEANEQVVLLLADGTRRVVAVSQIDVRETASLSPMPSGLIKTPDELRDLLSYLLLDRPLPP
jgi:putative heme-binding domain-containing protein